MSFRYQPETFAPDPWPVSEPTALNDEELAAAVKNVPTPDIYEVDTAALDARGTTVVVWMLLLGSSYGADREYDFQGFYIRAVVRDKLALRDNFTEIMRGEKSNEEAQLALSFDLIPQGEYETRLKIVGWAFAGQ